MPTSDNSSFLLGEWQVSPTLHRIRRGDDERQLEPKVMQVLLCLASRPGRVVSHDELIERVWDGMAVSGNVVTYSIAALRKALEDDWRAPRYIETISKSGYRLVMGVQPVAAGETGATTAARAPATGAAMTQSVAVPAPASVPDAAFGESRALPAPTHRGWVVAASVAVVLAIGALAAGSALRAPPVGTDLLQPLPVTTFPGSEVQPTLSPDGNHVAFAWMKEGRTDRDLYVTLVGAETAVPLAASEDHERSPAWTPDGLYIAYARWKQDGSDCGIYKIPAIGGASERIAGCPGRPVGNMSFSPDGGLLAVGAIGPRGEPAQVFVIDLQSGETRQVGDPPADRQGDYYPLFSPDGNRIVFSRFRGDGLSDLYTVSPRGGAPTRVTHDNRDIGGADWTADGTAILFSSYRSGPYTLWRVPAAGGEPRSVAINDHQIVSLSVARSGRIAYSRRTADVNLWAVRTGPEAAAAATMPLSSTKWEAHPQISPSGERIAFASDRSGTFEIYSAAPDGSDLRRHTSFGGPFVGSPRFSPDGRHIVFDARPAGNADIWLVGADSGTPQRLTDDAEDDFAASFSADGAWIYFTSHRSGTWQIWRRPFGDGEPQQVTVAGAYRALEGPAGEYLYFGKYDRHGIWRLRLDGRGIEEPFFPGVSILHWGSWVVRPEGLYFFRDQDGAIARYDSDSGEVVPVVRTSGGIPRQSPSLSVGDGWIVWAQVDASADDIYVADGVGR